MRDLLSCVKGALNIKVVIIPDLHFFCIKTRYDITWSNMNSNILIHFIFVGLKWKDAYNISALCKICEIDQEIPHSSTIYPWLSASIWGGFIRDDMFFGSSRGRKQRRFSSLFISNIDSQWNRRCFLPPILLKPGVIPNESILLIYTYLNRKRGWVRDLPEWYGFHFWLYFCRIASWLE